MVYTDADECSGQGIFHASGMGTTGSGMAFLAGGE